MSLCRTTKVPRKHSAILLFLILASLAGGGCKTYQQQSAHLYDLWRRGEVDKAADGYARMAQKKEYGKDQIIWKLEEATAERAAGKIGDSLTTFDAAEARIDEYERQAEVKLASETAAMVSNQANLPYRGKAYDKIMLNTYKALDYLELGNFNATRVELIRAYQRQQSALQENRRRIQRAMEQQKQDEHWRQASATENNPAFNRQMESLYSNLDQIKAYEGYVNPFTTFLDGLFHLYHFADLSDVSRARESFGRVIDLVGENKYLKADWSRADQAYNGAIRSPDQLEPMTYVIFETGRAPVRDQVRIDVPILFANVSYVGAAFPQLRFSYDYYKSLKVKGGRYEESTVPIASMDSIIAKEFKDELPLIITKTLVSSAAKAAGGYFVNQAVDRNSDPWVALLSRLGTAAIQAAVNIADLRTWTTLPKEFQYCALPTPEDGKIILQTPDGGLRSEINLPPGGFNLVYVRSISTSAPLLIARMSLR